MTFDDIIKAINFTLLEKQPLKFSPSWILKNNPCAYRYIWKNIRTETNEIDWDTVTSNLNRSFQKRWTRYRHKQIIKYKDQDELNLVLNKYKDKLYTFLTITTEKDKHIQDRMVISLVRLGQKGNICAQEELIKWVTFITDDWIDRYPQMYKWKGYTDEVPDKIRGCIRCYRYTGSFLGYLFKTLEYSVRGKPPLVSLNDKLFDGSKTLEEYAKVEEDWQIYK